MDEMDEIRGQIARLEELTARAMKRHGERISRAEEGLSAALFVIDILVRTHPNPPALDAELRGLRLWVQSTEAGRVTSEVMATSKAALRILELAMGRGAPP